MGRLYHAPVGLKRQQVRCNGMLDGGRIWRSTEGGGQELYAANREQEQDSSGVTSAGGGSAHEKSEHEKTKADQVEQSVYRIPDGLISKLTRVQSSSSPDSDAEAD